MSRIARFGENSSSFFRKLHCNGKRKVMILAKMANLATILQSFSELLVLRKTLQLN